jgi:PKD repeat protein
MQPEGTNGHPASAHPGTYLARNRTTTLNAGYVTKLVSPALNLTLVSSPFLTFWHTQEYWASQDELRVYYKTSQNGTWNLLATYTSSIASWTRETIALPNASSAYFIAFESTVQAGYGVCLDDIMVSSPVADFSADANFSCTGSLTVNFTDNSIGNNGSWAWDIDANGTTDYTTQNPTHIYSSPGLYTVKLSINFGGASLEKENHILVMSSEPTINTGCALSSNSNNGNGAGIGIYRFALGNIDYTTSHNNGYYQNYTCTKWTPLELNTSYNITIRTGTANNEGARVYIDYNDNGTFESGESVVSFPSNKDGTRTLSFTTPSSGVTLDKGLRLRVLSRFGSIPSTACDIGTYGQAEDYTIYFTGDATWTGTTSTDWATAGNWNINSVPITSAKVKIPSGVPNYPVLTNDVTCKDLTIMAGASLTINPGKALTVSGMLTNSAGNTGLVIKSDASGTGSLIHSTPGVNGTMKQYLTSQRWHFVSTPVSGATINSYNDIYFKEYNEPTNDWTYLVTPTTTPITVGKGYSAWASDNLTGSTTISLAGELTNTDVSLSGFSYSPVTNIDKFGFHLIGNPYPCALDWNSNWNMTDMSGWMIIYDNGVSKGIHTDGTPWNGMANSIIPATQGFWVRATSASASITIPASQRLHNGQAFYKEAKEIIYPYISLQSEINSYKDEALIIFHPECTSGYDGYYDLSKFDNVDEAPNLFTLDTEGNNLAVNFYEPEYTEKIILVGFRTGVEGLYTLSTLAIENFNEESQVYLEDLKTSTITNLTETPTYEFYYQPGDDEHRFNLHFKNSYFGIGDNEMNSIHIYAIHYTVFVETSDRLLNISIVNLMGQEIVRKETFGNEVVQLNLQVESGVYLVKVQTDKQLVTEKMFIR